MRVRLKMENSGGERSEGIIIVEAIFKPKYVIVKSFCQ